MCIVLELKMIVSFFDIIHVNCAFANILSCQLPYHCLFFQLIFHVAIGANQIACVHDNSRAFNKASKSNRHNLILNPIHLMHALFHLLFTYFFSLFPLSSSFPRNFHFFNLNISFSIFNPLTFFSSLSQPSISIKFPCHQSTPLSQSSI